ncbi:MAG: hypothetical protein IKI93_05535, partial [Clostridia bacterium]|nr:hypothetical protein [Clostridia bacterium]
FFSAHGVSVCPFRMNSRCDNMIYFASYIHLPIRNFPADTLPSGKPPAHFVTHSALPRKQNSDKKLFQRHGSFGVVNCPKINRQHKKTPR